MSRKESDPPEVAAAVARVAAWVGPDAFCNRCGAPHPPGICPVCLCPEFSLYPDALHAGYLRWLADAPLLS